MAQWYYTTNKQQMGPVSFDELKQLAGRGLLKPTDLVWSEGMSDWVRASSQGTLFASKASAVDVGDVLSGGTKRATRGDEAGRDLASRERQRPQDEDRPRRSRRDEDYDDEEDDDERPRRRSRRDSGMPVGLKVGLIVGGVVVLLIVVGVVIYFVTRGGGGGPVGGVITVGPGGFHTNGRLTNSDRRDTVRRNSPCHIYTVKMFANKTYVIDHMSQQFDAFLRVESPGGINLMMDDDGGDGLNSRIVFRPAQDGEYRVIATILTGGQGPYSLSIREN
ncbi:MAG: DUF4339 domain-containing protein [Gemmataceae bacterium]|nr:DUF4339 domain-containing protein [Gemmataceae bacterium]